VKYFLLFCLSLFVLRSYSQEDDPYNASDAWYAHPILQPHPELHKVSKGLEVDVFFLHPTTYYKQHPLNFKGHSQVQNRKMDRILMNQASVFSEMATIYAPAYAQAGLPIFLKGDSVLYKQAMDSAYADIKRAFSYYLKHNNQGRPIILASHSQGSFHLLRLLKDFMDVAYFPQFVTAYVLGIPVSKEQLSNFKNICYCSRPEQTQCFVSWMSIDHKSPIQELRKSSFSFLNDTLALSNTLQLISTNPCTWDTVSSKSTTSSIHMLYPSIRWNNMRFEERELETQMENGFLKIDGQESEIFNGPGGNLHRYDYNLFYGAIWENARMRLSYFQEVD
jgi:hypothetical protein